MTNLIQAVWVEMLKARRSRMPILTSLSFSLIPLVGGFFMIVLKDPDMARRVGLITVKAQIMIGSADWPTYLEFMALAVAVGGVFLFGLITSWVFSREYVDRTAKDLLALPTTRSVIVVAKFVVIVTWSLILTVILYLVGLVVGAAVGLPPLTTEIFQQGTINLWISAGLTIVLATPIAFAASAGHGYLPPIGVMILAVALAQTVATAGYGKFFPLSIPGLLSQGEGLATLSYVIVLLTGAMGLVGTLLWWEYADQTNLQKTRTGIVCGAGEIG